MAPRPPRLADPHDVVGGVLVGDAALDRPDAAAPDWRQLRFAEDVLRECAAVVSYVADAEARAGFEASAEHYRRLHGQAGDALPVLHRVVLGGDSLPASVLDDVRLGVDRLVLAMEALAAFATRRDDDTPGKTDTANTHAQRTPARRAVAS